MRNSSARTLHAGLRPRPFFFDKVIDVDHAGDIGEGRNFPQPIKHHPQPYHERTERRTFEDTDIDAA